MESVSMLNDANYSSQKQYDALWLMFHQLHVYSRYRLSTACGALVSAKDKMSHVLWWNCRWSCAIMKCFEFWIILLLMMIIFKFMLADELSYQEKVQKTFH